MPEKQQRLNFSDLLSVVRKDFEKYGYSVTDKYEEEPLLPIDLFCTKSINGENRYCIVLIASVNDVTIEYQQKLMFYQYYISLHYKPILYSIILVVPSTANIDTIPWNAETPEEKKENFYKVNGFGLWKINQNNKIIKTQYPATSLGEKIHKDFEELIVKEDPSLKNKSQQIARFIDRYIHDSVLGIALFNPPRFNERFIDGVLLEKALKIANIHFKTFLCEKIDEHLSKKGDDYLFCTNAIELLWDSCVKEVKYPNIHKKYETLLKEIYPRYRDHYIHLFQVFLLGAIIIDGLKKYSQFKENYDDICTAWMLTATFHDVNFPIQKHDDYMADFFLQTLGVKNGLGLLELKKDYTEYEFSSNIEHIISFLTGCFDPKIFIGDKQTTNLNKIREFFYYKVTNSKNHGVLSSLGLLKKFEGKTNFSTIILPAASAIALHDDEIWQPLHGLKHESKDKDTKWIRNVERIAPLKEINFDSYPLSFLLILCDNIQDWGRHVKDEDFEKELGAANITLKNILFTKNQITIQLYFDQKIEGTSVIDYKMKILRKIEKLLRSPNMKFIIEFWDRERNQKTNYIFTIN